MYRDGFNGLNDQLLQTHQFQCIDAEDNMVSKMAVTCYISPKVNLKNTENPSKSFSEDIAHCCLILHVMLRHQITMINNTNGINARSYIFIELKKYNYACIKQNRIYKAMKNSNWSERKKERKKEKK